MSPRFGTVFLDRDGVLNRKKPEGTYIRSYQEFKWLPGSRKALQLLGDRRLIVVTNQRGVARGYVSEGALVQIHRQMEADLANCGVKLAGIYVCPHEEGTCTCRKPKPGLLQRAAGDIKGLVFEDAIMFGDSIADVEAATAVGCPVVLIGSGQRREAMLAGAKDKGLPILDIANSLLEAVQRVIV